MIEAYLKPVYIVRKDRTIEEYSFMRFMELYKNEKIVINEDITMLTQEGIVASKRVREEYK
jgi:hypothetical protein